MSPTAVPQERPTGSHAVDPVVVEEQAPRSSPVRSEPSNLTRASTFAIERPSTAGTDFDAASYLRRRWRSRQAETARPSFIAKAEWLGRIDEVFEDTFTATLTSRDRLGELDSAELDIEEVSLGDRDRIRPGAVFYWVLGYRDEAYGQRIGMSVVRFRHLVAPSDEQLSEVEAEIDEVLALFDDGRVTP